MHNNIMFGNNSRTTNGSICEKTIKNLTLTMFIKCISFQKFLLKKFADIHFMLLSISKVFYLSYFFISEVINLSISVFPTLPILWLNSLFPKIMEVKNQSNWKLDCWQHCQPELNFSYSSCHNYIFQIMSDSEDTLFPDQSMLWNCQGCAPPPKFDLPPPPRPPWMEEVEDCSTVNWNTDHVSLSEYLAHMESCDSSTLIRDSQSYFEDTFHSIMIIVVCSVILVFMILFFGLYIFK